MYLLRPLNKPVLVCILFMFNFSLLTTAQEKFYEVLLTNGVEYIGKVSEINDHEIKFSHKGESLVYTISISQIFRIAFASGRTQIFTTADKAPESTPTTTPLPAPIAPVVTDKYTMAILPFRFTSNKLVPGWQEMAYRIQEEAYVQVLYNIPRYRIQPIVHTNAILMRKGIDPQQLRAYTLDELANILGVGFILTGEVNMRLVGYSQVGSQSVYQNTKPVQKPNGSTTTSGSTLTIQNNKVIENYATFVSLKVYNDRAGVVFSRSKESVWSTPDAYKATLSYLLKRTGL